MVKEKIAVLLNEQINMEYGSSYGYLAMAKYFHEQNLNGFANWMRVQAQEELIHGMKIFDFMTERDGIIHFSDIKQPCQIWDSVLHAFESALANENKVSESIYGIVEMSLKERDYATNNFLQWFVAEQVEEEAMIKEVIDALKLVGTDGNGLFLLDRDFGQRTIPPEESPGTPDIPNNA
jgi:ferritin